MVDTEGLLLNTLRPRLVLLSTNCKRDRRGMAALEFALIAPVFLAMIISMVCFGLYLAFLHELQELSSSAARSSVAGLNEAERDSLAQQFVVSAVSRSALLNAAALNVSTATSGTPATNYSVTVTYSLNQTPIPLLASLISVNVGDISRTSTVVFGGY